MDDREDQSKVNLFREVLQAESMLRTKSSFNTSEYSAFLRPFFQSLEHFSLHVNTYDFPLCPNHPGKGDTEESHSASDIQNRHPFPDIGV